MKKNSPELNIALRYDRENPIETEFVPAEEDLSAKQIGFVGLRKTDKKPAPSTDLFVVTAGKVQIKEVKLIQTRT